MAFIQRASIWQRLLSKLLILPSKSLGFSLEISPIVVPILDVDTLLSTYDTNVVTANLSGGGPVGLWSVPSGKRWTIYFITRHTTTASAVYIALQKGSSTTHRLRLHAANSPPTFDRGPFVLEQGDQIIASGGGAGDTAIDFGLNYREEDAF